MSSQLLKMPAVLDSEPKDFVVNFFGDHARRTNPYGPFAKDAAITGYDLDLLVMRRQDTLTEERAQLVDAATDQVRRRTGNSAQFLTAPVELDSLIDNDYPLSESLRTDGRALTEGTDD
ncbi:hypothetical protein [Rathayibacter soli]|uniref:hypothetical protein n=1 Tax=Rathayibacter soli TaxID=3144168 RepID=UPI0027E50D5B|nr:hypothetical protein [Glaciibacter superstes]